MTDPAFLDELERRIIAARVKFLGNAAARYRELRQLDEERWAPPAGREVVRREDELINNAAIPEHVAGIGLSRNPGVAMLWITRTYEIFRVPNGNGVLIQMGEPDAVEWYACGRAATRAEVLESIDTGLPNLEAIARQEKGGLEALERARKRFEKWIPGGGLLYLDAPSAA